MLRLSLPRNNSILRLEVHLRHIGGTLGKFHHLADESHLDILAQGVEAWNSWRVHLAEIAPGFTALTLREANLSGADLSWADLGGANLSEANLEEANLSNAELGKADLSQANLTAADLYDANLEEANLTGANLTGAKLSGVASGAYLRKANLSEANLTNADLTAANLDRANLVGADLTNASLTRAHLYDANLKQANLSQADLTNADLSHAEIRHAILAGAKLSNAYLFYTSLLGADLTRADLTGTQLSEASLSWANLTDANLSDAALIRTDLSRANLSRADLSRADLTGSLLTETNLEEAILSGCCIYGISVWDVQLSKGTVQSNLIISRPDEPTITVDDLEVAQFVYLLLNYKKLRNVLRAITERGVLILGRFSEGGSDVLKAIAAKLRELKYQPIVFDFDRPDDRNYTETVKTLVGLSRFVIVDLSGPSVPQELYATVPHVKIPFVPILEEGRRQYAMSADILEYPWVVRPPVEFTSKEHLLELIPSKIVAPAEAKRKERQALLDQLFGPSF